jgi:hypothetical protein
MPREWRRELLADSYAFTCACRACCPPAGAGADAGEDGAARERWMFGLQCPHAQVGDGASGLCPGSAPPPSALLPLCTPRHLADAAGARRAGPGASAGEPGVCDTCRASWSAQQLGWAKEELEQAHSLMDSASRLCAGPKPATPAAAADAATMLSHAADLRASVLHPYAGAVGEAYHAAAAAALAAVQAAAGPATGGRGQLFAQAAVLMAARSLAVLAHHYMPAGRPCSALAGVHQGRPLAGPASQPWGGAGRGGAHFFMGSTGIHIPRGASVAFDPSGLPPQLGFAQHLLADCLEAAAGVEGAAAALGCRPGELSDAARAVRAQAAAVLALHFGAAGCWEEEGPC